MARFPPRYDQRDDEQRLIAAIDRLAAPLEPLEARLFGSRAGEHYTDGSDWDLILVSPAFAGVPFLRRGPALAYDLSVAVGGAVELLCYTPEEAQEKAGEPTPIGRACREGRVIRHPGG